MLLPRIEPLPRRVPSYRLHKATGQAVVTLSGRDFYLGRYRSIASKDAYERLIAQWESNGRRLDPGGDLSIVELVRDYLEHAKVYYRKHGRQTGEVGNLRQSFRLLLELYADTDAAAFSKQDFKTVRDRIIATGAARTTINGGCTRIRRLFRWAAENDKVPESVYNSAHDGCRPSQMTVAGEGNRSRQTRARCARCGRFAARQPPDRRDD
jgi:hypothetical protein